MATSTSHRVTGTVPGALRALQVLGALTVLCLLCQGVTAGQLLERNDSALFLHATGAIVLHVLSGLTMIAAALVWRATHGPIWPTVLTAAVFLVSFAQAWFGEHGPIAVHVPLALLLVVGAVWALMWSLSGAALRAR